MQRTAAALALASLATACAPGAGPVLDKQAQLQRFDWWDNRDFDWYADNIPFVETPDAQIDATYYYRWEVLTKHLVYGSPADGYTFTEFIDRPFWSGAYGSISCPLGHQMYEVRWLKSRRIVDDFARYWMQVPGAEPRTYSNWYGDAVWATYRVLGDREWVISMLPLMERQYAGWTAERWDAEHGMFRWDGMHDGMETNINSRQTPRWFDGAEGYRPTLNAYLYADAVAISKAAVLAGDATKADEYASRAAALKSRVLQELWDPEREFFFQQFAHEEETVADPWPGAGNQNFGDAAVAGARIAADGSLPAIARGSLTYESGPWAGSPYGREQIGFVPWQFGLPDPGYESAWQFLMDPERFHAPFGPAGTEKNDPLFYVSPRCCVWSGNSWPYATSQTLTAMANLLNDYDQSHVDRDDFVELFGIYSRTQRKQGRPYIAEAAHPETGSWAGHDRFFHSEHYLHSSYIDVLITGLLGLRPQDANRLVVNPLVPAAWDWFALDDVDYRGHSVSVIWDRDGTRYGRGAGLRVLVDDEVAASSAILERLEVALPAPISPQLDTAVNWAANNAPAWFPAASASSSRPHAPPAWAVDGQFWYHASPPNRWVPDGTNDRDWLAVDFGAVRALDRVVLYFLDDTTGPADFVAEAAPPWLGPSVNGDDGGLPVAAPRDYSVELLVGGEWIAPTAGARTPSTPAGRRANTIRFGRVQARGLRVHLEHAPGAVAGLSEVEAWGPGEGNAEGMGGQPSTVPPANFAFSDASPGAPAARASFATADRPATLVNDGEVAFNEYTDRVWTTLGSAAAEDWIEIDLGTQRQISAVELYLWAREDRGTAAPANYRIEIWDGDAWGSPVNSERFPPTPLAMALNVVRFSPLRGSRVRVSFEHALPAATAVSEIVVR